MTSLPVLLIAVTAAVSWASPGDDVVSQKRQHTEIESAGNLQSFEPIGCIDLAELKSTNTPADIYEGFGECLLQENYDDAFLLFIVASAYGAYDSQRVLDPTAHQAPAVLFQNLMAKLGEDAARIFQVEMMARADSSDRRVPRVCEVLARVGPPSYYPTYMIQHGMGAFGKREGDGLDPDFDGDAVWRKIYDQFLKCAE